MSFKPITIIDAELKMQGWSPVKQQHTNSRRKDCYDWIMAGLYQQLTFCQQTINCDCSSPVWLHNIKPAIDPICIRTKQCQQIKKKQNPKHNLEKLCEG